MSGLVSASTLAYVSAGASVAGAGATAAGKLKGGQAQSNASYYQAQVARNNAEMARQQAERVVQAGEVQSGTQSLKNAGTIGAIKTRQAANGIDVNTGSAVDVRAGAREAGQLDAETVLNNANVKAYGFRVAATQDDAQAQLDEATGAQAGPASALSAGGGLLSSVSSLPLKFGSAGGGTTGTGGTAP